RQADRHGTTARAEAARRPLRTGGRQEEVAAAAPLPAPTPAARYSGAMNLRMHASSRVAVPRLGLVFLLGLPATALAQQVVPMDGQVFTANTVLVPGTYSLPHGVSIGAANVTLDLNGATLVG